MYLLEYFCNRLCRYIVHAQARLPVIQPTIQPVCVRVSVFRTREEKPATAIAVSLAHLYFFLFLSFSNFRGYSPKCTWAIVRAYERYRMKCSVFLLDRQTQAHICTDAVRTSYILWTKQWSYNYIRYATLCMSCTVFPISNFFHVLPIRWVTHWFERNKDPRRTTITLTQAQYSLPAVFACDSTFVEIGNRNDAKKKIVEGRYIGKTTNGLCRCSVWHWDYVGCRCIECVIHSFRGTIVALKKVKLALRPTVPNAKPKL